ncbi:MAG: 4-vinyl reductase [Synechococcales cyanobacterium]
MTKTAPVSDSRPPLSVGKGKVKHSHYSYQDFFRFNHDQGTIIDWNQNQNILLSEDFIVGLQTGLEREVGDASAAVMYSIGQDWGKFDAENFLGWFEKEFSITVKQANLLFLLETWWWPFTAQGWGKWEVELAAKQRGFIFINLFDSMVARSLGDIGKPVCHLYAGLFAGFFTSLTQRSLACVELQCYAMGETYCKFLLGGQDRIDAANFWINEGASAKEIERRMFADDLPTQR